MPDEIEVWDFERFGLRIAVRALEDNDLKNALPYCLSEPDVLALRVKELLVQELPPEYLRVWRNPAPFGSDCLYKFIAAIPKRTLLDAAERAGLLDLEAH